MCSDFGSCAPSENVQSTTHQNGLLRAESPVPEPDTDKDRQEDVSSMPEQHFQLRVVSGSHPGRKRPNNEDHFAVDESRGIIVLADGMGGHRSGEVASEMATRLLMDKLRLLGNTESTEKEKHTSCSMASDSQLAKPTRAFIKQRQTTPSIKGWEPRLSRFC